MDPHKHPAAKPRPALYWQHDIDDRTDTAKIRAIWRRITGVSS
jgi:hypothetical protein